MFKQMQYFIAVVETQSFTKAAEECYISQSAISQQIKALEEELDTQLLIRYKKSFSLTLAGEYFYKRSKEVLEEVHELCQKTKEIEEDENVLKIGYLRGYPGKELKEAIVEFSSLYPDVSIDLKRGNHEKLYNYLLDQQSSVVISDQRRAFHDDYVNYHLLHMECYVEISTNHPLSEKDILDVDDLKKTPCIVVASQDQQAIEQEFYENIIGLKCPYIFANDIDEARLLVAINKGFMPIEHAQVPVSPSSNIKVIPLYRHHKQLQRNYCAFWRKEKTTYYIEEFVEILRKKMRKSYEE